MRVDHDLPDDGLSARSVMHEQSTQVFRHTM